MAAPLIPCLDLSTSSIRLPRLVKPSLSYKWGHCGKPRVWDGLLERGNLREVNLNFSCRRNFVCKQARREETFQASCTHYKTPRNELDNIPLVKICGITNVKDAIMAAEAGAKYVGMILWPKSKRSVSSEAAKVIAQAVRMCEAEPVGVFVDEDAAMIEKSCKAAGISIAQLHGDGARSALVDLPSYLKIIYVIHADKHGAIQTTLPEKTQVDWILVDSLQGGSGRNFDWVNFQAPTLDSKHGWLLAGGLNPENVAAAISILKPDVVDVSSGVTGPDGIAKDQTRVLTFIDAVRGITASKPFINDFA